MKDPIIQHINENRDEFDNDTPDQLVWDNINNELHPEKKKKGGYIWFKAAAVVAVLFGMYLLVNNSFRRGNSEMTLVDVEKGNAVNSKVEVSVETGNNQQQTKSMETKRGESEVLKKEYELGANKVEVPEHSNVISENKSVTGEELLELEMFENPFAKIEYSLDLNSRITSNYTNSSNLSNGEFDSYEFNTRGSGTSYNWSTDTSGQKGLDEIDGNSYYAVTSSDDYQDYTNSLENPGYYYEQYQEFNENKFVNPLEEALSTFSIDVDVAGYSNLRRYINDGYLPTKEVVKLEEMVNYFDYKLPQPTGEHPFSISTELGNCPWNKENKLLQICIKGKEIEKENLPTNNLVFLLDVSGSMDTPDKLGLVKRGFKLLVNEMRPEDRVSIVVYAGAAGVVLPPTGGSKKDVILEALHKLTAGGSTAGGQGIEMAYKLAEKNLDKEGNNRIILATDGDFNVGMSGDDALVELIEEKRKTGISLSVMGFGTGNLNNSMMEKVADNGNGNYSYIDNVMEAKKVFVTEMGGTLFTIAKDVKLQLEFNPSVVKSYRLLGYENRMLAPEDFNDDLKDAGELGAGHSIIALYEIVPADDSNTESATDDLKYQTKTIIKNALNSDDLVTIKFRYKEPQGTKSKLITKVVTNKMLPFTSANFQFASSVAEFGLIIRDSEFKANADMDKLIERARRSKGADLNGYRSEFVRLAEKAQILLEDYLVNYKDQ